MCAVVSVSVVPVLSCILWDDKACLPPPSNFQHSWSPYQGLVGNISICSKTKCMFIWFISSCHQAFGNAKTTYNNNSSRFGKFIQVNYLENGIVRGWVTLVLLHLLWHTKIPTTAHCLFTGVKPMFTIYRSNNNMLVWYLNARIRDRRDL